MAEGAEPVVRRLGGKRALVTGAASGIGRATAIRFVQEGASVLCADLNEAGLAETLDAIAAAGGAAHSHTLDVSDPASCAAAASAAAEALGGLDTLANIAGILRNGHTESFAPAQWDQMIGVNLSGVFYMSQAALPLLLENESPSIVNLASVAGLQGIPYGAAYSASKAGVIGLTRALAAEFVRRGLRVNAICPGGIATPMTRSGINVEGDVDGKLFRKIVPMMKRIGQPEEVAALAAYLASDESSYMTGVALPIDGGQLC